MDSLEYAVQMEKKLIDNFKTKFFEKLGYYPEVITKHDINNAKKPAGPILSLDELEQQFKQFLPKNSAIITSLKSKRRKKEIVELRQMFCYMARKMGYSLTSVGKHLGNKHHTTIMHNIKTFHNLFETDQNYRYRYSVIHHQIKFNYDAPVMDSVDEA